MTSESEPTSQQSEPPSQPPSQQQSQQQSQQPSEPPSQQLSQPLPAEVRLQLTAIAADVIGRTPPAELPAGVRRFARFAPSKRLRLGAAEIAAALAGDDMFRGQVAEVVRAASPDLVETVLQGRPPATADPIDVAVIAYLLRPSGWQELLDQAAENLSDVEGQRVAQQEIDRLTSEVSRLRAANADAVRARDSGRQSARQAASEHAQRISELQREVRALQGQLRVAQRAAEAAAMEAAAVRRAQQQAESAATSEVRKARNRIAELEQQLEANRRASRSDRDQDNARLWLLLEQIGAATAGLRRELDVSKPVFAPADTIESSDAPSGARPSSIDGSLLERLLSGAHVHLIVDGYNVTKTGYPDLSLADQRFRLVSSLGALAARTGVEITVAFDGTAAPLGAAASLPAPRGVRVLFSALGELADDLIRSLLRAEPSGRTVVVASSDQEVATSARAADSWVVGSAILLSRLDRS